MTALFRVRIAGFIGAVLASMAMGMVQANAVSEGERPAHDPRAVINSVLSAWRRVDAHAIAALYEPDGDFVSPTGDRAVGHGEIEAFYQAAFKAGYAGTDATASAAHVRALSASFVLIDGSWSIRPTSTSRITDPESGLFCAVLRWHGGRWRIVALREQSSGRELRELNDRSSWHLPMDSPSQPGAI
jgi:uncharacterized protein (TIGR02246 family)